MLSTRRTSRSRGRNARQTRVRVRDEARKTARKGFQPPQAENAETRRAPAEEPRKIMRPFTMFMEATSRGRSRAQAASRRKLKEQSSWPAQAKPPRAWVKHTTVRYRAGWSRGVSQKSGSEAMRAAERVRHLRVPKRSEARPQSGRNRNL